jgi:HD-like signal output (HDOD) protein
MMHDIGRLGLMALDHRNYAKLLNNTGNTNEDILEAERMAFKVDHCEAGAWLTRAWKLPDEFQRASSQHHARTGSALDSGINLARLACAMAHALGYKAAPLVISCELESLLEEVPNLPQRRTITQMVTFSDRLATEVGPSPFSADAKFVGVH